MEQKIILVDMDDTATWLLPVWVKYLNLKHNLNVDWRDIKEWDMALAFTTLTREQIYEPLATEEIWDEVTPREGAVEALTELYNSGYEIFICTSTDYRNIKPKFEKVIQKYFPFIDWEHFIVASRKQMINADFIIDDSPYNLVGGCQKHKIIFPMPHNEDFPHGLLGIKKYANWKSVCFGIKMCDSQLKKCLFNKYNKIKN